MPDELIGTVWVCVGCLILEANGENIGDGGDGIEPLAKVSPPYRLTPGVGWEDHESDCLIRKDAHRGNVPGDYECECETNTYSTSQCDGCGSFLHGERHAMTLWKDVADAQH